jgi:hypothetical protein
MDHLLMFNPGNKPTLSNDDIARRPCAWIVPGCAAKSDDAVASLLRWPRARALASVLRRPVVRAVPACIRRAVIRGCIPGERGKRNENDGTRRTRFQRTNDLLSNRNGPWRPNARSRACKVPTCRGRRGGHLLANAERQGYLSACSGPGRGAHVRFCEFVAKMGEPVGATLARPGIADSFTASLRMRPRTGRGDRLLFFSSFTADCSDI